MSIRIKRMKNWVGLGILVSWDAFKGVSIAALFWTIDFYPTPPQGRKP